MPRRTATLLAIASPLIAGCGASAASQSSVAVQASAICRDYGARLRQWIDNEPLPDRHRPFAAYAPAFRVHEAGSAAINRARLAKLEGLSWPASARPSVERALAIERRAQAVMDRDARLAAAASSFWDADRVVRLDTSTVLPLLYEARGAWQLAGVARWCP